MNLNLLNDDIPLPESMNRPNFFPGQLIDYRDFNRLSQHADKTVALLCQYLFRGGGIVVDALEEFSVEPLEDLRVRLRPGIALLPNGQAVALREELILDLTPYRNSGNSALVVGISYRILGTDRYTDQADPSIAGYKTELVRPEIRYSTNEVAVGAIELFRVALSPTTQTLRTAGVMESWQSATVRSAESNKAVIDLRFRSRIVPQTYVPLTPAALIELRGALYTIEQAHRKIQKLYLFEDPFHTAEYLTQTHAEILSRPFQPLKVSFLVSEFADRLCRYLEALSRRLGNQKTRFDEDGLFRIVKVLEEFRVREVLPEWRPLDGLLDVAKHLDHLLDFGLKNFHLLSTVEEDLLDLRNRHLPEERKRLLAGFLFDRIDRVTHLDRERWSARDTELQGRSVRAQFANGDPLVQKGIFFKSGVLSIDLQVPVNSRLICVLLTQYVRRAGSVIHYEINGKPLGEKLSGISGETAGRSNLWINQGLVIPPENLVNGRNVLRIIVDKSDLDFGFFDCTVYQPQNLEVSIP